MTSTKGVLFSVDRCTLVERSVELDCLSGNQTSMRGPYATPCHVYIVLTSGSLVRASLGQPRGKAIPKREGEGMLTGSLTRTTALR